MIRVRFAPSPTGFLHIGGVRTALFNFLYARNQNGKFLLRLEDTDRERSRKEYEEDIVESLRWLGLDWDEGIVRQSSRLKRYQEVADELLQKGLAYEENKDGKKAIKFKMPSSPAESAVHRTVFHDLVHGEVRFNAALFDDLVILKSDGFPTYHLACVVDDHDMEITHIIRGDDHLSNTPRQILLYEALGWKPPKYAHLPLIFGMDGTPLSKRHGVVSAKSYHEEGFLAEGLLNYLALLGWGPENNQEFFPLVELVRKFSLKRVTKSNARFNQEKLEWLNGEHIKRLPESDYLEKITAFFPEESKKFSSEAWKQLTLLYRSRIKTFRGLLTEASYCFSGIENYDSKLYDQFLNKRDVKTLLDGWLKAMEGIADFENLGMIETLTREAAQSQGKEAKEIIHPLRFALTGKTVSPGLFELMRVLGKEMCVKRVKRFLS
ncbi:MAG TPA: glutamate--tRNA ligase [bacterium]|nr:glutamate--tRNA ligase [bacterium]